MIIYYCKCEKKNEFKKNEAPICECGRMLGDRSGVSDHINMRSTWSGQTQVEFSQTIIDKDIAQSNNR